MNNNIIVNHIGFLCAATKQVFIKSELPVTEFTVQDMGIVDSESFDEDENWKTIFRGKLVKKSNLDGIFYVGDFSEIKTPGVYSVVVPELKKRSFQFIISDGVYHDLPWLFVDFLYKWNGNKETALKVASTTDDGIRSDNGEYHPVKTGWYDAGDLRKWMTHTNLPAIGFYDLAEKIDLRRNYYHEENLFDNDLLTISDQAINLILEMQDPETGRIFECLGAGGMGRADENMSWWYENHSGCLADNSDNRFTDNKINSGDERKIRTDYNALIQYTSVYILLRAVKHYSQNFPEKANQILLSAKNIWKYSQQQSHDDPHEKRTAVKSWKLMAATEMLKTGLLDIETVEIIAQRLLANYNPKISFWCQDEKSDDPYRGILHSAQAIIALINYLKLETSPEITENIKQKILKCWKIYILPLSESTLFGYMPYGTYFKPASEKDTYTPWKNGLFFRRFMPNNSKQKINHGLNGHYSSWAHALALMGNYFEDEKMIEMSWNQIYWMLGSNNFNVSFISGIGYNNPMPHSRFLGTAVGGFMSGFIGNTDDTPHVDLDAKAQWNSTEYWNTPVANTCMALAELLTGKIEADKKLGVK